MSASAVRAAVRAHLADLWTATPFAADAWDRDDFELPEPPAPVLTVEFVGGAEDQITIGAPGENVFRERGLFQLHLFVPQGEGDGRLIAWADQLRALFRGKDIAGVRCGAADPPEIGPERGNWLCASVAIEYSHDQTG